MSGFVYGNPITFFAGLSVSSDFAGTKTGQSLLIEDGALPWIVENANNEASTIRRHIELALCHLAQHGKFSLWFLLSKSS